MIGHAVARVLGILVGHLYPLYRTFKVCSIPEGETSIDSQRLVHVRRILAFWAVHGAFTFAEYFVDFFIFWFPLYYEAKVLFLLWLVHSNFEGATFIFDNLISEALSHNELDLDASLERSKEAVKVGGGKVLSYVVQNGASLAKRCMAESHNALLESVSRGAADKQKRDSGRFEEVTEEENEKKAR